MHMVKELHINCIYNVSRHVQFFKKMMNSFLELILLFLSEISSF